MTDQQQNIWNAITSVLNHTANNEEKIVVENWLNESTSNKKIFATIANLGFFRNTEDLSDTKKRLLKQLQQKIQAATLKKQLKLYRILSAASVFLVLVMSSWMASTIFDNENVAMVETKTANGCKTTVILSDGTVVNLNAGSTIQYPAIFSGKYRDVKLTGEGYFEVKKDNNHPFIVSSENLKVKVLGTHFNIKAFPQDDFITTTLLEGAVNVSFETGKQTYTLKRNEQLVFNKITGEFNLRNVEANLYSGWKNNEYYFERVKFEQIARELERGYNIKIIINTKSLRNETFSGTFEKRESFYKILDVMKKQRGFDYTIHEDTIKIYDY